MNADASRMERRIAAGAASGRKVAADQLGGWRFAARGEHPGGELGGGEAVWLGASVDDGGGWADFGDGGAGGGGDGGGF